MLLCSVFCRAQSGAGEVRATGGAEASACAGETSPLTAQLQGLAMEALVAQAHWGMQVADLDGRCLAQMNGGQLFHPASTAKLLTTGAAMAMGAEARVTTRVEARGPLVVVPKSAADSGLNVSPGTGTPGAGEMVLAGDLALVGAGDGAFATDDVPYQEPAPALPGAPQAQPPSRFGSQASGSGLRALGRLADAVIAAGVTKVEGDVVGDDTRFVWEPYPEDWAQDDLMWGYGAPVSALSVHDNQVLVGVRAGPEAGAPAVVEFESGMPAWWTVEADGLRTAPAGSGTHVGLGRVPGRPRALRVWGSIAADAPEVTEELSIEDPAVFAAEALRSMLLERGVQISGVARAEHRLPQATVGFREQVLGTADAPLPGASSAGGADGAEPCCVGVGCVCGEPAPVAARVLAEARSPTVADDAMATNKESLNLHAELLLERLGDGPAPAGERRAQDGRVLLDAGSRAAGVRVVRSVLAQASVDPGDVVLVDGSGLSTHDLVTPRAMVQWLLWANRQPWFATWRATLPVAGVDGTLSSRFVGGLVRGRLQAKTGTLGEARALTGYLQCTSGRMVALSIMVDNHVPGSAADRDAMDRMVEAIYEAE